MIAFAALALVTPWTAHVHLRFLTEGDTHRPEVETVLRWNDGRGSWPDTVQLRIHGGLGGFVRGVDVTDDRAELPVPDDGDVHYTYTVVLEHEPEAMSGYDGTPHALADAALWTGRALFLLLPDAAVRVVLEPLEGEHVSTSLEPLREEEHTYRADSAHDASETYIVVGRHEERRLELAGTTFILAVDGRLAEASDFIEEATRKFVEAATETVSGTPNASASTAERCGSARASPTTTQSHPLHDRRALPRGVRAHRRGLDRRLSRRGGGEGPARGRQARLEGARAECYQGGALAAVCMDIELRRGSRSKHTLDEVLVALYEQCAQVDFGDVRWALARVEPSDEVEAVVIRRQKRVKLTFRTGGRGQEIARTERKRVRLVSDPEAKKRARTIREAVFE